MSTYPHCACATYSDGSKGTGMCPLHAEQDPCLTMSNVTGRRRKGTMARHGCTNCGWSEENKEKN